MGEEVGPWFLIATTPPPTDDREFYVGMWHGDKLWNSEETEFAWARPPIWVQLVSHRENPQGPHVTRGWNHRNGPLGGNATHWAHLLAPPPLTDPMVKQS